ncbi:MAG: hypothetical protein ACREBI_10675 [Nitrosotalea sp.]
MTRRSGKASFILQYTNSGYGIPNHKLAKRFLAAFTALLVLSLVSLPTSYGLNSQDQVTWQLVFLSADHGCGNYHYQMMYKYDEIAAKYFELYKFPNAESPPICMPGSQYSHYKVPSGIDLIILVSDYEIGRKELNNNGIGGFYEHVGTDKTKNHIIEICDCPNFHFSDPVWLLSHELSHFILYYDGFNRTIAEDYVHKMGGRYDYCMEVKYTPACDSLKTKIHGTYYFSIATVMKPYGPAVGITPIPQANETISPELLKMQQQVTGWWLAGKISDQDYAKSLSVVLDKPPQGTFLAPTDPFFDDASTLVVADGPDFVDEKKVEDLSKWSNEKMSTIFSRVPFKDNGTSFDATAWHLPQWFKSRAYWWSQGQYWNDTEFISSAKYLLDGRQLGGN